MHSPTVYSNGAFEIKTTRQVLAPNTGTVDVDLDLQLEASKSNAIYGNSLKVQPAAYQLLMIIKS